MSRSKLKQPSLLFTFLMLCASASLQAATITVGSLGDTGAVGADCELRSAIIAANTDAPVNGCEAGFGTDVIDFEVQGNIVLTADLPVISESLLLIGPGRSLLNIDGNSLYRQFNYFQGAGDYAILNLTISAGTGALQGGCVRAPDVTSLLIEDVSLLSCHAQESGGAVYSNGDTTITRSLFMNNSAVVTGGAFLTTDGTHEIEDSTFSSNSSGFYAGALAAWGQDVRVHILRSTFYDNRADNDGGAIYIDNIVGASPANTIRSSTITGNVADANASGVGNGGGMRITQSTLILKNTIIAGNSIAGSTPVFPDLSATGITLEETGHNIIGINTGITGYFPTGSPNASGDYAGSSFSPVVVDFEDFGQHGGPLDTIPPLPDSIAIDNGTCPTELTDQRGFSNAATGMRAFDASPANADDGCDVGAIEYYPDEVFADGFEVETL